MIMNTFATWWPLIEANKSAGVLCCDCGTYMATASGGKPRRCDTCREVVAIEKYEAAQGEERERIRVECTCPQCGKMLRSKTGRDQHIRLVHQQVAA